jgi:hypothetical protein
MLSQRRKVQNAQHLGNDSGFPFFWIQQKPLLCLQLLDVGLWRFHIGERCDWSNWSKHAQCANFHKFAAEQPETHLSQTEAESTQSHVAAATNALTAVQNNAGDHWGPLGFLRGNPFLVFRAKNRIVPIADERK